MRPEHKICGEVEIKKTEIPSAVYKRLADLESNMFALNTKIALLRSSLARVLEPANEVETGKDESNCEPFLLSDRLEYNSMFISVMVSEVTDIISRLEV